VGSAHEQLRKKERAQLQAIAGPAPVITRAVLFAVAVGGLALFLRYVFGTAATANPGMGNPLWWILPSALLAGFLIVRARRWTGGPDLREKVRQDLERGEAAVHTIQVLEAIVVEQQEDEGPIVFVQTELSGVIRFAGQYLDREVRRGFPWQEITIREAPLSRVFFGLRGKDEGEVPVHRRGPLTRMEASSLGPFDEEYVRLRMDFDTLKNALSLRHSDAD
jgi:hypothetical protein